MDERADSDVVSSVLSLSASFSLFESENSEDDINEEVYESEEPDESSTGIVEPYQFEPLAETSATDTDSLDSETANSQNRIDNTDW